MSSDKLGALALIALGLIIIFYHIKHQTDGMYLSIIGGLIFFGAGFKLYLSIVKDGQKNDHDKKSF